MSYFYPRSPCGERRQTQAYGVPLLVISIHVPLAGNVTDGRCRPLEDAISIHVPLAGNVDAISRPCRRQSGFLSTFPLRGTSALPLRHLPIFLYFYPRSPCGERQRHPSDAPTFFAFLSTFPLRGTSMPSTMPRSSMRYFYPRSPCGERPWALLPSARFFCISIHVPLAGNVVRWGGSNTTREISIHVPLAGNVGTWNMCVQQRHISIHVPLAGNVPATLAATCSGRYFYPRSPCGERHKASNKAMSVAIFLSTFPLRGTSHGIGVDVQGFGISIHVPLAGNVRISVPVFHNVLISIHVPLAGNVPVRWGGSNTTREISIHVPLAGNVQIMSGEHYAERNFYPRSPCGERLCVFRPERRDRRISIHVPLAGNVHFAHGLCCPATYFYPRSPCGERHN